MNAEGGMRNAEKGTEDRSQMPEGRKQRQKTKGRVEFGRRNEEGRKRDSP
jgi:hypothetical protein